MRRFAALASAAFLSAALAHPAMAQEKPGPLAGGRLVALGSSFAAGSGFGPTQPNTPQRCGRSAENYAMVLAETLRMALVDVSCGGATTAHVLGPWNELPPQIDALTADTDLVTITIGGNDIGYVGYLIAESCKTRGPIPMGAADAVCPVVTPPDAAAYTRLEADMQAIAAQVKARAPNARLVFVQYLAMVPKAACADVPLTPQAAQTARAIAARLAQITARVARANGATLFDGDRIAARHMPCGADEDWVAAWPANFKPGDTFPWHPTRAGHAAIARQLAIRLTRR